MDSEYITRLHLVKTPWFAICLHWLNKPDPEPYLHDHPVAFLSVILRGGYTERRWPYTKGTFRSHKWLNFVRATPEDRHTIVSVKPSTLTLCFMGPKRREWGFHIPDSEGLEWVPYKAPGSNWVMWKDYYAKQRAERAKRLEVAGQA